MPQSSALGSFPPTKSPRSLSLHTLSKLTSHNSAHTMDDTQYDNVNIASVSPHTLSKLPLHNSAHTKEDTQYDNVNIARANEHKWTPFTLITKMKVAQMKDAGKVASNALYNTIRDDTNALPHLSHPITPPLISPGTPT